ncbi:MAG: DUF4157 domain-containing protein [bacterium]
MNEKIRQRAKIPESERAFFMSQSQEPTFSQPIHSSFDNNLFLHRAIGNQGIQRLVESDFVQAKLKVSQPNDKYEQEADRGAEQVMSIPEPQVRRQEEEEDELIQTTPYAAQNTLHRQTEEEDEIVQTTIDLQKQGKDEEKEEELQTKEKKGGNANNNENITSWLEIKINGSKGKGNALPINVRNRLEPRYGFDFQGVTIHTDDNAAEMNKNLNAKAFTFDNNIYFNKGMYNPGSLSGQKLIAHELTHVIQQGHSIRHADAIDTLSPYQQGSSTRVQRDSEPEEPKEEQKEYTSRSDVWNDIQADIYQHYPGWVRDSWHDMNHKLTDLMKELDGLVEDAKAESKAAAAINSSFLTLVNAITQVGGDVLAAGVNQYHNRLIDLDWRGIKERIPNLRDEVWKNLEPHVGQFNNEADRFIEDPRVVGLFDASYSAYEWKEHNASERAKFRKIFSREIWPQMEIIYRSSYTLQWEEVLNRTIGAAVKKDISSKVFEEAKPFFVEDIKLPRNLSPKKIKQFVKDAGLARQFRLELPISRDDALYLRSGYSMLYWQVVQESAPAELAFKRELDSAEAGRWISGLSRNGLKIFDATDNYFALDEVATPLFGTLDQMEKRVPLIDLYSIGQVVKEARREIAKLRTNAAVKAIETRRHIQKYFKLEMSHKRASYDKCIESIRSDYSGRIMRPGESVPYHQCIPPRPFLGLYEEYLNAAIRHGVL